VTVSSESLATRIADLKVGGSLTLSTRIPIWTARTPEAGSALVAGARRTLKNRMSPHVARAVARRGGKFEVDTSVALTFDHTHLVVSATATRVKAPLR
jgi:hypothetical protein